MVNTKKALETLWNGRCTVYTRKAKINPANKRTEFEETELFTGKPCRLSFEVITSTTGSVGAAAVAQSVKLFISPEPVIPAGSKIIVVQNGVSGEYERSGEPAVYANHQEIMLQLFKGWA